MNSSPNQKGKENVFIFATVSIVIALALVLSQSTIYGSVFATSFKNQDGSALIPVGSFSSGSNNQKVMGATLFGSTYTQTQIGGQ